MATPQARVNRIQDDANIGKSSGTGETEGKKMSTREQVNDIVRGGLLF